MTQLIKKLSEPKTLFIFGLFYTLVITIVLLLPGKELPKYELPIDKLAHVLLQMCLAVIWLIYFFVRNELNLTVRSVGLILTTCFIYGIVIEIIQQRFVVYRQADIWDIAANTLGLILGYIVFNKTKHSLRS